MTEINAFISGVVFGFSAFLILDGFRLLSKAIRLHIKHKKQAI